MQWEGWAVDYDEFVLNCMLNYLSCSRAGVSVLTDVNAHYGQCFTLG